jgi:hypothetical protein
MATTTGPAFVAWKIRCALADTVRPLPEIERQWAAQRLSGAYLSP